MSEPCNVRLSELADYRFGELSGEAEAHLEAHLFECARCAERAGWLVRVESGVKRLFSEGSLSTGATLELVERAEALGLTLRTYTIDAGGAVACTAAPDDDLIVVRLCFQAEDDASIDLDIDTLLFTPDGETRQTAHRQAVAYDRQAREVVYVFAAEQVRAMPRSQWVMHARVHTAAGTRDVGPFTMNHTPWPARPPV